VLHVISVISNPIRYKTRVRLFKEFMARIKGPNVTHWIVEAVFGNREPTVLDPHNPHHIRVRCDDELWLKENLINVGARHLPDDAKYVMWLDGDVRFERPDWAEETIAQLQHFHAVQPFSHVVDLGPEHEVMQTHKGFGFCFNMGDRLGANNKLGGWKKYGGPYWHPGYAFAFTMEAWNAFGGMIDKGICGSGDFHMACALIGQGEYCHPRTVHPNYKHMIREWQKRADACVKRNIGYVPGTITHYYHGSKKDRQYTERWSIIVDNKYDPYSDVHYDRHGVLRLTDAVCPRTRGLRDGLKRYFRERREDD
jgi:hypothetical protein